MMNILSEVSHEVKKARAAIGESGRKNVLEYFNLWCLSFQKSA